jgi:hypothetical protein
MAPLLLLAAATAGLVPHPRPPLARTQAPARASIVALYLDDPWLQSKASSPTSRASLEALFRYGPVVYYSRCFDKEEYNASVRKLMDRYPKISRELAEQEIHEFLFSATDYLAKQTPERTREGPQESELKDSVTIGDKLLVVAWICILALQLVQVALGRWPRRGVAPRAQICCHARNPERSFSTPKAGPSLDAPGRFSCLSDAPLASNRCPQSGTLCSRPWSRLTALPSTP